MVKPRALAARLGQGMVDTDANEPGVIVGMTPTHCVYMDTEGKECFVKWAEVGLTPRPPKERVWAVEPKAKKKKKVRK